MFRRFAALFASLLAVGVLAGSANAAQPVFAGGRYHAAGFGQPLSQSFALNTSSSLPTYAGYDSVDAAADPYGAEVLSCYTVGSRYANCPAVRARAPKHLLTVAVNTSIVARCLDVEPSDATPSQAGGWAYRMIHKHGYVHPCFYADGSEMPSVQASAKAAGIPHCTPTTALSSTISCYLTHVAIWDDNPAIPPGQDGKQWKNTPNLDYDTYYRYFFRQ